MTLSSYPRNKSRNPMYAAPLIKVLVISSIRLSATALEGPLAVNYKDAILEPADFNEEGSNKSLPSALPTKIIGLTFLSQNRSDPR